MSPSTSVSPTEAPAEDVIVEVAGFDIAAALGQVIGRERVSLGNNIGRIEYVPRRQPDRISARARASGHAATAALGAARATASATASVDGAAARMAIARPIRARGERNFTDEELLIILLEAVA